MCYHNYMTEGNETEKTFDHDKAGIGDKILVIGGKNQINIQWYPADMLPFNVALEIAPCVTPFILAASH